MKQFIVMLLVVSFIFILSCGDGIIGIDDTGYATITVHNLSDYDVTDITITVVGVNAAGRRPSLALLRKGEVYRFDAEWLGANIQGSFLYIIEYHINGNKFGVEHQEDALWIDYDDGPDRFVSPRTIQNGSVAEIFIRNESYEFAVIKGEVEWYGGNYDSLPGGNPMTE